MKKTIFLTLIFLVTFFVCSCQSYPADKDNQFDNGSNIVFPELDKHTIENLELLGKLWGFLKYNHPKIGKGDYNWDYELLRILPEYLHVTNNEQRDKILLEWINKYGEIPVCNKCKETPIDAFLKPDLSWINNNISIGLKKSIEKIYHNRHQGKHYYISMDNIGNPTFLHENPYSNMPYPDQGFRLLSLYRFWNIIQYFSPYKNLTDKDWNIVLKEYIPKFLNVKNELEYELIALQLIGETNDTHAGLIPIGNKFAETLGKNFAPFRVRFIENKLVVTEFLNPEIQKNVEIKVGDVITHIAANPIEKIVDSVGKYYPASNDASKLMYIALNILRSHHSLLDIQYISNNQNKKVLLKLYPADSLNLFKKSNEKSYKKLDENIGYVTLAGIKNEDIPVIKKNFEGTKGIIIDIRKGVSQYVPYMLGSFFVSKSTEFAKLAIGNIDNPGEFQFIPASPLIPFGEMYKEKLVVIVNEFTQSQGEFTTMAFRSGNNTVIIGSTTAGTDGGARPVFLPGNLKTLVTGYGVFYPDGKQTQRVGIVPDIIIAPTIEGIKNEKDEVLEKAIEIINNKK